MVNKILAIMFILVFTNYAEEIQISADRDNTILSENGSNSNATGDLFVGKSNTEGKIRRALIHFDVSSSIPADATIESVTLSLNVNKTKAATQTISIHRIISDWGEGTSGGDGNGGSATAGDATWTYAFFDTVSWTNAGGDFEPEADASASVAGIGIYDWESTPEMVSTVQSWLDNPQVNFGWLLIGDESSNTTTKRFDSRENTNKPKLTVSYSVPTTITHSNINRTRQYILSRNYPNPFNPTTTIEYTVKEQSTVPQQVNLSIYNILGQKVATLVNKKQIAGSYQLQWNASDFASGVYYYKIEAGKYQLLKKMIFLK